MGKAVVVNNPQSRGRITVTNLGGTGNRLEPAEVVIIPLSNDAAARSYRQDTPAATWTVQHNLTSRPPMVLFVDSDPDEPVFTDILYPDLNTAVIEWPSPETGWVFF